MSTGEQSMPSLIARIRAGDRAACEDLVRDEYDAVYRFSLHLTADTHAAADLTQETFRAAWQKLPQFDGRSSVASWLHRIVYNQFIDSCRKNRRVREIRERLQRNSMQPAELPPWRDAAAEEGTRCLVDAVAQLPNDQRALIALHYFEGLSLRETADVVGQPVGTVKWRVHAALRTLRTMIDVEMFR
jgi:RNA polymerase sigma-70 factor, ECF subfamily